jgi:hypothetical protein
VVDLTRTTGIDSARSASSPSCRFGRRSVSACADAGVDQPDITRVCEDDGINDVFRIIEVPLGTRRQFGELNRSIAAKKTCGSACRRARI